MSGRDGISCLLVCGRDTHLRSATLKIFRERVEPSQARETEIFSETFSRSGTVEYPISVSSDLILGRRPLAVLFCVGATYNDEDDDEVGKGGALHRIAKDGTGSRTVLKTYENPLIGARSPVGDG